MDLTALFLPVQARPTEEEASWQGCGSVMTREPSAEYIQQRLAECCAFKALSAGSDRQLAGCFGF